jgi:tetratricopeptide (TPR) repeat protein
MINPYEFSSARRSLYLKIAKVIQALITLGWAAVCGIWGFAIVYLVAQFIRNNWTKVNRKPAWQWLSEQLAAYQETLHTLFLLTMAAVAAIYLLAACHKFLKYSRGALIDATGNMFITGGLIFLTMQCQQGASSLFRIAIVAAGMTVAVTLLFGILQGIRCGKGKLLAGPLLSKAQSYYEVKDFAQAKILLESTLRYNPYQVEALYLLAEICYSEQQSQQALLLYGLAYEIGKMQLLANPDLQNLMQTIRQRRQSIS